MNIKEIENVYKKIGLNKNNIQYNQKNFDDELFNHEKLLKKGEHVIVKTYL
ncbi:MAG: hypothetical protein LBB45_05675 [Methanobrevibacter sp.]|jgi:hypothetical protein|nr:hypothetical protein [Candidatus Methanovirga basalitermitum]